MADIDRNFSLVEADEELKQKHYTILVNEKLSQINGLKQRLEDLKNIESKRVQLKVDVLTKEIHAIKQKQNKYVNVEFKSEKTEE